MPLVTAGDFDFKRKAELDYDKNAAGDEAFQADIRAGKVVKCFIVRCTSTKIIFGHCIPYKGAGEDQYVANLVVQAVEWLGHTRLILKTDNEPALHILVEQSLEEIRIKVRGVAQVSIEHSPRYDSQSNGGVEAGVRILRGHFRTLKLCLEARIGKVIPTNHALIPWLLEYTAMMLAATYVGTDGKTAWCRARGRNFKCSNLNFAELGALQAPGQGPHAQSRWQHGLPVGRGSVPRLQPVFEHVHCAQRRGCHHGPDRAQAA